MAYGSVLQLLSQRFRRRFKGVAPLLLAGVMSTLSAVTGCTKTEEAVLINEPPADSTVFWPRSMEYARRGDTLYLQVHGLKRRAVCAVPVQISWNWSQDTTKHQFYRLRSSFEIPAGAHCASDPAGLDTMFRRVFTPEIGNKLYLQTPDGTITDSILFVTDAIPNQASVMVIKHAHGVNDSTTFGRFTFFDSTSTHPKRVVKSNALDACEILQTAVYERKADTTFVKVRLIRAAPQPSSVIPECAGPYGDSVPVVFNRYNYLPSLTF